MKLYCWQCPSQLRGNKRAILFGVSRVFAMTNSLLAILLLSACVNNQPQQRPTSQPTQNQQESSSKQNTQSSADQTGATTNSEVAVPNKRSIEASESPSDLNRELSESLGTFDEVLLSEQEKIDNNRPYEASDQSAGFESDSDKDKIDEESAGSNPEESTETVDSEAQTTGQNTSSGTSSKQTPKSGGNNSGVDGSDDDIVARQLREAAEKEQDPQLKAKLWEEYYRYKQENSNE